MKPTMLVVDDEPRILRFIRANLKATGSEVVLASTGAEAISLCEQYDPDLILLDLGLPDMDGLDVFARLRQFSDAPVIILTARSGSADKVKGLDLGADDYMVKPFNVEELQARVRAVLRRSTRHGRQPAQPCVSIGPLCIDIAGHEVQLREKPLRLTPTEFKLLAYLVTHVDRVVLHEELLSHVWGPEYREALEYLWVTVGRIRQKLGDDPESRGLIQTVPGVGYKMSTIS